MKLPDLFEGRLVRRYKRFLADIEIDGKVCVCHCPNPGSMTTCAIEGGRVWVSRSDNPARKLAYTWELAEVDGHLVCINTQRANPVIAEAIAGGQIPGLFSAHGSAGEKVVVRREVRIGQSRLDFVLESPALTLYAEVKNVTLALGDGVAGFPDAVTARGTRHLRELIAIAAMPGHLAAMVFCVSRTGISRLRPADDVDPVYGRTLRAARDAGVMLLAHATAISTSEIRVIDPIAIDL